MVARMDIVDAQVHVFYAMGEQGTLAVMQALGIQGLVIDELWRHTAEGASWPFRDFGKGVRRFMTPQAQAAALRHPDRFALLQRITRHDPDLPSLFSVLGDTPGCRAVRINLRAREERQAFRDGGYDALLGLAQRHGLAVCLLIHGRDVVEVLRKTIARFPDVRFVLDHLGNPKAPEQWDDVLTLSALKNLWLKWCHGHHFFEAGPYPYPGLQKELARALDAYGAQRMAWASDFTHDRGGQTWGDLFYYVRESSLLSEGDKEWLLGRSAREVFNWPLAPRGEGGGERQSDNDDSDDSDAGIAGKNGSRGGGNAAGNESGND
jgi:predicted TIM-barrel fold metal-dependent hydrolase